MLRTATQKMRPLKMIQLNFGEFLRFNFGASFHTSSNRCRSHTSRETKPVLMELNRRRKTIELNNKLKEVNPMDRRSSFLEWNFQAELAALNGRLGENIPAGVLTEVFTTEGHIEAEREKQEELNIDIPLNMKSNTELSVAGENLISKIITNWLRGALPALPEEGVQAVKAYLTSEDILADLGFHIGFKDLLMAVEYPPLKSDFAKAFKAFVGALERQDVDRAENFILDLVAVQLVGKDINEIWDIPLPMRMLSKILENQGKGEPEARMIWQLGPKTLLANYTVGIYSDKELIGEYHGETLEIAEEMAARDALRKLFKTDVSKVVLPTKEKFANAAPNPSAQEWTGQNLPNLIIG